MKKVRISGSVPIKFVVTMAIEKDGEKIRLAAAGVPAVSKISESRSITFIRLDITRGLRRYLSGKENTKAIHIYIEPVDARGKPLTNLEWSVEEVIFETADNGI